MTRECIADEGTRRFLSPKCEHNNNGNQHASRNTSEGHQKRNRKWTLNLMWMSLGVLIGIAMSHTLLYAQPISTLSTRIPKISTTGAGNSYASTTTITTAVASNHGYVHSNITYGHIHIPKTAGTTINGELALGYERICGHKGYSYDAITTNQRIKEYQQKVGKNGTGLYSIQDVFTKIKKGHNRGRVPPAFMFEIGFQDCDWISIEDPGWKAWPQHVEPQVDHLELHVPCRDPIDHLLSMCNHLGIQFQCDLDENPRPLLKGVRASMSNRRSSGSSGSTQQYAQFGKIGTRPNSFHRKPTGGGGKRDRRLGAPLTLPPFKIEPPITTEEQIDACMVGMGRFHYNLTHISKFDLKCFNITKTKEYMHDYMGPRLQPRRVTEEYVFRSSNNPRHKERECLNKASPEFKQRVFDYMLNKYDYYQFCHSCMGTENDLFVEK